MNTQKNQKMPMCFLILIVLLPVIMSQPLYAQNLPIRNTIPTNNNTTTVDDKTTVTDSSSTKLMKVSKKTEDSISKLIETSRYFYYKPFETKIQDAFPLDYSINHRSQPDKVLLFDKNYYAHIENAGHPHLNLFFDPVLKLSTDYQCNVLSAYLFTPENIKFYQLQKAYTELQYFSSFGGEHFFNVIHSQNIFSNWNVNIEDYLISSEGLYLNSSTLNNYFSFNTHYFSKSGRYRVKAGFIYNYSKFGENGGIQSDSLFTQNIQTNRSAIPVNLMYASTKWKEINAFVNQSFLLRKEDSAATANPSIFNTGTVSYTAQFQRQARIYFDTLTDLSFYENNYIDAARTYDSIGNWNISNTIFWTNDIYSDRLYKNPVKLLFGIRQQYIQYSDILQKSNLSLFSPFAKMHLLIGNFNIDFSTEFSFGNYYNKGDFTFSGQVSYQYKRHEIKAKANFKNQDPDYIYTVYNSNHFQWNNSFDKELLLNVCLEYSFDTNTTLGFSLHQYKNAVFFDENIQPFQHSPSESLIQIYTGEKWRWKIFSFDNFAALQFASNTTVFRLPVFELKQTYALNFHVFNKSLFLQTGINLRYNTSYYGDSYSPALASFYRQNNIKTGNNIWLDVFVTGQIKNAFVFVKLAHINALFDSKPTYYMIPHYPTQDFEFKWGVIWKIFG